MGYDGFNNSFIIKWIICFILFVILPVWIFKLVEISFLTKFLLTIAGGAGVAIALSGKSLKLHK